ncbi:hypothetical protein niasHT_013036 [Heterodera trifolii]|uniref:Uncharacterized protein n=1 Tax=Heterodera trifolii TaxID=157864 RepID=A0ABD2L3X8_9BILA
MFNTAMANFLQIPQQMAIHPAKETQLFDGRCFKFIGRGIAYFQFNGTKKRNKNFMWPKKEQQIFWVWFNDDFQRSCGKIKGQQLVHEHQQNCGQTSRNKSIQSNIFYNNNNNFNTFCKNNNNRNILQQQQQQQQQQQEP